MFVSPNWGSLLGVLGLGHKGGVVHQIQFRSPAVELAPFTHRHLLYASLAAFSTPPVPIVTKVPIVSFTFDDFQHSAAVNGAAILEQSGVRGTFYTAPGLINKSNGQGHLFNADDLRRLAENGHEIASHTYSHVPATGLSAAGYIEEIAKGREVLEELTGVPDSGNFAYPFGVVTRKIRKALEIRVTSARTSWPGLKGSRVRTHLLRANELVGAREAEDRTFQPIRRAEARPTRCFSIN